MGIKPTFDISVDYGGSRIKVTASFDSKVVCFSIDPEVYHSTDLLPSSIGNNMLSHLWISSTEGDCYALGELARIKFNATIPLRRPKSNYVLVRTMGAVAAIANEFDTKNFSINLRCLLPAVEFDKEDDRIQLRAELTSVLAEFVSPIGTIRCRLKKFNAVPEGMGLVNHFFRFSGGYFDQLPIACVMFGHRNTSTFLVSSGIPQLFRSSNLGFIRAIEFAKVNQIEALANRSLVDQSAIETYWRSNRDWLIENLPESAQALVVGGGPVPTISQQANEFFSTILPKMPGGNNPGIFVDGGFPSSNEHSFGWPKDIKFLGSKRSDTPDQRRIFADVFCDWQIATQTTLLTK
jgi:hypothetical protein